jgi:hypothetical protein
LKPCVVVHSRPQLQAAAAAAATTTTTTTTTTKITTKYRNQTHSECHNDEKGLII